MSPPGSSGLPRGAWLALGATASALVGGLLPGPKLAVVAVAVAAILGIIVGRRPGERDPRLRRTLGPVAFGVVVIALRLTVATPAPPTDFPAAGDGHWSATVIGVGAPRDGHQAGTLELEPSNARVAATLPRYPAVVPGDRVTVAGGLRPLPDDDGGYGTYLRRIGAVGTVTVRSLEVVGAVGGPLDAVERARRAGGEALTRALPEPEAGLAAGILIGLRDRVDRDLAAAFTTAGVSHIVAISGWNIAVVAAVVAALLRRRVGRRSRTVLTLTAVVAYTLFAGASPSVVRAAVMAAVVLGARESGRAGAAAAALGWAVALLLLVDPATVTDAGFQLSVLATAGLIAWATRLTDRLRSGPGRRLPGWLTESLGISFAAEAATLPVVLLGFGRLPLIAPLVNLAVVPLVPPAMAVGTLAGAGGWLVGAGLPPLFATILGLPGWLVLAVVVWLVRFAAALPFASVTVAPPWNGLAAGAIALGVLMVAKGRLRRPRLDRFEAILRSALGATSRVRRRTGAVGLEGRASARGPGPLTASRSVRAIAVVLALSLVSVVVAAANRPDGRVRVTVLDVGQGDAILVEGGRGGRLLVDGGPDPDRLLLALDARVPPWDRRIDLLVLTHPHEDHVAGLALLLDRYRVGRTFEPGMVGPGPGYRAWRSAIERLGIRPATLATGDRFALDEIRFRVLWPDRGRVPREPADGGTAINNVSIVLLGEVGRQRFLLAGDIEEGIDPVLLARGVPRVDLLKVAHHGSRTASTGAFLDAARPKVAIVSAGAGNPYGHPAPATLGRIADRGARVLRTDRDGSVEVTFDGLGRLAVATDRRVAVAGDRRGPVVGPRTPGASGGSARAVAGAGVPVAVSLPAGTLRFTCGIPPPTG